MNNSVVAVVVCFNRKILLLRCINALINQSKSVEKIIIVDNASTDGTKEYLSDAGLFSNPVIDYHLLPENIGGAGGFNKGMKIACGYAPSWVWLMDDDGWPDKDCLSMLFSSAGQVKGPIVIDDTDSSQTSFPYTTKTGVTKIYKDICCSNEVAPVHPFNGVLLSADVISTIGWPDAKYFIWGDEIDYRSRWLAAGYKETVVANAKFYHPEDRQVIFRTNKRSIGIPLKCSSIRKYCYYRNQVNLHIKRIGYLKVLGKLLFTIPDVLSTEKQKLLFLQAVVHGTLSIFGKHKNYL